MSERCCGSCKYLDTPKSMRTTRGTVSKVYNHRVFNCTFPEPQVRIPACYETIRWRRNMMAPAYGADCPAWERVS